MTDKQQVENMTDRELVAAWNISQAGRRMGNVHRAEGLFEDELKRRGIPHEVGKRTEYKVEAFQLV